METRLVIAYSLIALLVLAGAAWIAYAQYNTRDRKMGRQNARDTASRIQRQAGQD